MDILAPRKPISRRFTLADALILIVAAAIAMALVRGWWYPNWFARPMMIRLGPQPTRLGRQIFEYFSLGISWTIPFGITTTMALLVMRARRPRPSWRRIARQPGTVGCVAALLAMSFPMGREVYCWILAYLTRPNSAIRLPSPPFMRYDNPGFHPPVGQWIHSVVLEQFPYLDSPIVCVAVAVSWGVLRAVGRWRPEAGWIDRMGRSLSVYWISLGILIAILGELWKFLM